MLAQRGDLVPGGLGAVADAAAAVVSAALHRRPPILTRNPHP
ncbi:hypothetical protein [Streptosporangium fragile]